MDLRKNVSKHYIYLDALRYIAVIAAAAHLLGFVESGWAAVCTLLMLAGYAAARNAFANEKYTWWKGLLLAAVRVYVPIAAVAGLVTIEISRFPQILWLSQKPETASVFYGINNFWQISALRDAVTGVLESPFAHMWAPAVLLHFAVLFPFLFLLLRLAGRKLGRAVPCWALLFLAAAGFTAFGLLARSGEMTAYLDSFARLSAPFLGMALAFFHHYYGSLVPRFARGRAASILILIIYLAVWVYIAVFAGTDALWRFVCDLFGMYTSEYFIRILLISVVSFRLIDYAALCSEPKGASFGALSLGISYEFYLLITPFAFFAPYVLPAWHEPIRRLIVIVGLAAVAGALVHVGTGIKAGARALAVRIPLLVLCLAAAGYGCWQFAQTSDPSGALSELSAKLAKNEEALVAQNKAYELEVKASEDKWAEVYAAFDAEREAVPGIVTQLHLTCLGDSVMVGSTAKIKEMFPNAYVDAKVGDTAYPALNKLKNLNANGTLGTHVVMNYGANGDVSDYAKNSIMAQIGDRPVYWLTNTFSGRLDLNDVLREFAKSYPNLRVVDWYEYTKDHPEYFVADGLHPTEEGQAAFARIIYEAISGEYFADIDAREEEQKALHEAEKEKRMVFVGNDLLTGAFPEIVKEFENAGFISISNKRFAEFEGKGTSGFSILMTRLQAAIEDGSLPYRVVLLMDNMSGFGAEEYSELAKLLSGRELHIVSISGSLLASPGSRTVRDVPSGRLSGIAGADIIEFCASSAENDYVCADRIHLIDEGNAALAELLAQHLVLAEE